MKQFKVFFLATNNSSSRTYTVTGANETSAKVTARSELMADGYSPLYYQKPLVIVTKPFPPMVALAHSDKRCQL